MRNENFNDLVSSGGVQLNTELGGEIHLTLCVKWGSMPNDPVLGGGVRLMLLC
jgi:hypothetical protein